MAYPVKAETFAKMMKLYAKDHTGPEHGLCDRRTAARARAKAESASAKVEAR